MNTTESAVSSEMPKGASSLRFTELDGLRGIAALAVVIYHLSDPSLYPADPKLFFFFPWGAYGVQLFFMISGFVILVSAERARQPRDFVISRFSRLYPPYWMALAMTTFLVVVFRVPANHADGMSLRMVLVNATMLQRWLGVDNVDSAYWTLGVELQFYAGILLLLVVSRCHLSTRLVAIAAAVWVIAGLGVAVWSAPTSHGIDPQRVATVTKLVLNATITPYGALFCTGMFAYLARDRRLPRWPAVIVALLAAAQYTLVQTVQAGLIVAGLSALFLWVAWRKETPILASGPLLWLGRRSYSLYIAHMAVGLLTTHLLTPIVGRTVATAIALVFVFGWTAVLYRVGEQHASRAVRSYLERRFVRQG